MKKGPNWNNYIMRKHGQSIREKIAEAYGVFAQAVVTVEREKAIDRMMKELPEDKWKVA